MWTVQKQYGWRKDNRIVTDEWYEPKVVEKFFKEINPDFEKSLVAASQQIDRIFDDAGLDITDMEFESFMEQCKNRGIC